MTNTQQAIFPWDPSYSNSLTHETVNIWNIEKTLEQFHVSAFLAPQVGFEPTTLRLTAECSAIELLRIESGSDLLSRAVSSQVLSALKGLTSVFGMGTGGTPSLWPPEIVSNYTLASANGQDFTTHPLICQSDSAYCILTTAHRMILAMLYSFLFSFIFRFQLIPAFYFKREIKLSTD